MGLFVRLSNIIQYRLIKTLFIDWPLCQTDIIQLLQEMRNTYKSNFLECSGSMLECLTQDRGVAGSSLTSGTALCP